MTNIRRYRPLVDWLKLQRVLDGDQARQRIHGTAWAAAKLRGNMDIELAVDAMELAPTS